MANRITREIVEAFLQCKTKGILRHSGQQGITSDYEALQIDNRNRTRRLALDRLMARLSPDEVVRDTPLTSDLLRRGPPLILDATLEDGRFSLLLDGLVRVQGHSSLGDFHYLPVLFHGGREVGREQRLLLEVEGTLLARLQDRAPGHALVWRGPEGKRARLRLGNAPRKIEQVLRGLGELGSGDPPRLALNDHCQACEFRQRCRGQAVEEDNLTLLRGIKEKEVRRLARKGIFTLTQLAHTFRPRRRSKKAQPRTPRRQHALHAMAIRDKRVYVLGTPTVPDAPARVYLDLEGKSDGPFVYLIGMLVVRGGTAERFSFWADGKDEEAAIFEQFLAEVARHGPSVVFCYGSYERDFLRRMRKAARDPEAVDRVLGSLVNVLSLVYGHLYFPCHSNGLKEVGGLLDCIWGDPEASGLQSLVWRARWEATGERQWREKLEAYNQDDCTALRKVADFVRMAAAAAGQGAAVPARAEGPPVAPVPQLDDAFPPGRSWRDVQFADADLEHVNGCAYFDYQRERVYVRSSEAIRRSQRRDARSRNRKLRCDRDFAATGTSCPSCRGTSVVSGVPKEVASCPVPRLKRAFDLVLTPTGVRRSVVHCRSSVHRCLSCGWTFVPEEHERLDKHFHGLKAWAMYHHVAHRLDLGAIQAMLEEFFGVRVFNGEMGMIKSLMARYYGPTHERSLRAILSGGLLHADETEVTLETGKGYVWVFTNLEDVVYLYRPNREADFLHEMLAGFRGVLVSDFYAGYDSLPCPQQKCLIHLIRDMNQELLANPFDEELRSVTKPFGTLLRSVVATVDEHGLRRRHLRKQAPAVSACFDALAGKEFRSEAAQALQARLLKCKDKLFTFLEHDGVPWNNNNAENAVKRFAYYREVAPPPLHEESLKQYLLLLGLYQSCRYKGVNFLRFLMSGERDLDYFCRKRRARERLPALQLYPEGFTHPHLTNLRKAGASSGAGDAARPVDAEQVEVSGAGV